MLTQKRKKKNPDDKERKRQIAEFIAKKGVTKVESSRRALPTIKDTHARCQKCGSWVNESDEYEHYDWCPTYKSSRKVRNPVKTRKSDYEYTDLIEVNTKKTSKDRIFLIYQGNEIEFTGKDAEELRDILKYQLSLFRRSSKLQKEYPEYLDSAGGYNTYITEQLQKVYPEVFR